MKLLKAISWRLRDLNFNRKLLTTSSLVKYYTSLAAGKATVHVAVKGVESSFLIRTNNRIDRNVLEYVFFQKYHLPPPEVSLPENAVIIDLGTNIGCTLVDFKMRYPSSTIYGYEMHPENYDFALRNTKGLKNVFVINKAVWINEGFVSFSKKNLTDAFAISKDIVGGEDVIEIPSISISGILKENKIENVDYLKMDIEGAELEIFTSKDLTWLDKVKSLNIEFHNIPEASLNKYMDILTGYGFIVYKSPHHWLSVLAYKT